MLAVSTLSSLRRVLFLVMTVIDSVGMSMPLHLREEYAKEEAQLVLGGPSGRYTGFAETYRVWRVRGD